MASVELDFPEQESNKRHVEPDKDYVWTQGLFIIYYIMMYGIIIFLLWLNCSYSLINYNQEIIDEIFILNIIVFSGYTIFYIIFALITMLGSDDSSSFLYKCGKIIQSNMPYLTGLFVAAFSLQFNVANTIVKYNITNITINK